jgi:hypothetical protein
MASGDQCPFRETYLTYPTFNWLPALAQYREEALINSPTAYARVAPGTDSHPDGVWRIS